MATKRNAQTPGEPLSAVEFINHYNSDVEHFEVELSMQITQQDDENVVIAGISISMGRCDAPAFIPSDVLRKLADEADEMTRQAVEDSNRRR